MTTAILMAAGCGRRISREINDQCKCTLDIGGMPLIRHTVQLLRANDIDVHVVVGYDAKRVMAALEGMEVTFHYNVFYSITNSLVSLWWAREALAGDKVILGNADVYWESALLERLLCDERDNVMLCDTSRVEFGDYLFCVQNERILEFGKGNICHNANCEYVGLALIQGGMVRKFSERLELLVQQQHHDFWWEQVLYSMTNEHPVWAADISGNFWAEIDYIEDYHRILEHRKQCRMI